MDMEKVIKGLECLAQKQAPTANPCKDCGYINRPSLAICMKDIASDALELLKEQDAKTGAWQWKIHGKPESGGTLGEAVCDQCGKSTYATAVKGDLNYCPNCGAKMEGR